MKVLTVNCKMPERLNNSHWDIIICDSDTKDSDAFDWVFVGDISNLNQFNRSLLDYGRIVLKDTIMPGTAKMIATKYGIDVACWNEKGDLSIVGDVHDMHGDLLVKDLESIGFECFKTSTLNAEICELAGNTFWFTRIAFEIELRKLCEFFEVDFNEIVKIFDEPDAIKGAGDLRKYSEIFSNFCYSHGLIDGALKVSNEPLKNIATQINLSQNKVGVIGHSEHDIKFLKKICPQIEFEIWDSSKSLEDCETIIILTHIENLPAELFIGKKVYDMWGILK